MEDIRSVEDQTPSVGVQTKMLVLEHMNVVLWMEHHYKLEQDEQDLRLQQKLAQRRLLKL